MKRRMRDKRDLDLVAIAVLGWAIGGVLAGLYMLFVLVQWVFS